MKSFAVSLVVEILKFVKSIYITIYGKIGIYQSYLWENGRNLDVWKV